ncbi:MAG: hypothetical protein JRL30_29415, partial [Deltaproteobacteria bacterium]|nr:hypothetical protein [Deltaproteobacteria bacterium]
MDLSKEFEDTQTLEEHLKIVLEQREKVTEIGEQLKDASKSVAIAEGEMMSAMKENGISSFSGSGKTVSLKNSVFVNVPASV